MIDVFTKVALASAFILTFAWVVLAQWRTVKRLSDAYLRLTHFQRVLAVLAVIVCTVYAQKPSTNDVNGATGTNQEEFAEGSVLSFCMGCGAPRTTRPTATRPYRLESISTNEGCSYAMPDAATVRGTWHLTGAYEDVQKVALGDFRFPLGDDLCDSLWAYAWGKVRPRLKNASNEIAAVGAPMSAIPEVSRFWAAATSNGTYLLTWENFAAGRVAGSVREGAVETVNAQVELMRNGDFITRSNDVESVYRRVNPDDWDDDGIVNEDDDEPSVPAEESQFGPHQDYPGNLNTNHYFWVDLVVSNANALVTFVGDNPCELEDPKFIARAGETNRVHLLIGKWYDVHCDLPICCVGTEDEDIQVWGDEHDLAIWWPVYMEFVERSPLLLAASSFGSSQGGGGVSPNMRPARVGDGTYDLEDEFCCYSSAADGTPIFDCDGSCGCGGCYTGDITYTYSDYSLTFGGLACGCMPHDDSEDTHHDEPDGASGPSVSARFLKSAIIFEDAYENEPGVTVPRRSTETEAEFYVYGGTNGGTYAFSIVNEGKLNRIGGGRLPKTGSVAAGKSFRYKVRYNAQQASGSEGDIIAKAEFSEFGTEQRLSSETGTLTAVKVEIEPVVTREGFPHRHRMGIREEFFARAYPEEASVVSVVSKDWVSVDGAKFECPIRAAVNGIRFDVSGTNYCPDLSVVEPIGIVCSGGFNRCVDGCIAMELQPYIAPLDVCFSRIRVMEVPTTQIGPSDYFTNSVFSSIWYHTTNRGAGVWHRPGRDNFFFNDIASFAEYCPPPIAEGNIDWLIPLAWAEDDATSIDDRIGIMANEYHQIFSLDAQGGLRIDKFSQWIKCSAEGYVTASPGIQK